MRYMLSLEEKTFDAEKYYREYNKKLFNNSLGEYPIKWTKRKDIGASVVTTGVRNKPSTWEITGITFSSFYEQTLEQFLGILVHEMIHVWQIETNSHSSSNNYHDSNFMDKLQELQRKVDFTIPLTEDRTYQKVSSDSIKEKGLLAVIVNNTSIQVYKEDKLESLISEFAKIPKDFWDSGKFLEIYKSNNIELQKYPISRGYIYGKSKFKTYGASKELIDDIKENGELAYSIGK